ncbi:Muramoyltetrapeptide carboxypeptidase LdcA (peptidoglycan recycling) [Butyrivibrio sp. ob235]|uniref:S66 family peptidase n=1 Tax=Butyrivibrio sp. ob235 TaxID=1761780 RepID=UPI0008BDFC6D|nr:S66 peptidase family protein [Butyrivibrio sp. ob235]SEL45868.1 Muramoyltetrapeptide carboxypeptidase LdcA (peptidoglycan recycling) [Butyrivibrio sp. ob235]
MIKRPDYIKPGDTIGITAPSFGPSSEPYHSMYFFAKKNLENKGYKIVEGDTLFKNDGIGINTDPKVAAAELVDFYKRDDIDAIISAGGGELMNETITNVDFEALAGAKPKWYIGYSDNTNFIFPLVTISGVQGIYGPCISGFSKKWELPEEDAMALLEGTKTEFSGYEKFVDPAKEENPLPRDLDPSEYSKIDFDIPYEYNSEKVLTSFLCKNGKAEKAGTDTEIKMSGILLGGCVDVLANMVGTRFDKVKEFNRDHKNVIWVLEACDLTPMSYRRAIWNMREAGWFDSAAGFVIGRPLTAFGQEMMGADQYNAVTDVVSCLNIPIIMDADIGHIDPMLPVVMGAEALVCAKGNDLRFKYE